MPSLPSPTTSPGGVTDPGQEISAWQARWELARLLGYDRKFEESIAQYQKLLKEKPDLWEARAELAKVLFWADRKTEALAMLESLPPGQGGGEVRLLRADLLAAAKRYPEAAALYRAPSQGATLGSDRSLQAGPGFELEQEIRPGPGTVRNHSKGPPQ